MTKILFKLMAVSALVTACSSASYAASTSTLVQVHGTINAATCNVNPSTTDLDLGNFKATDFGSVADTFVTANKKSLSIQLTDCDGLGSGQAYLQVSGPTTNDGFSYFNSDASSKVGIAIREDQKTKDLVNNELVALGEADAEKATIEALAPKFDISMKSSVVTPASGLTVSAPITFTFIYK